MVYLSICLCCLGKLLYLISEFTKIGGYEVNTQKPLAFLYTNHEKSETEIKKLTLFTIATKIIKCLGANLPKKMKELYTQKYKTLMKEINNLLKTTSPFKKEIL